MFKVISLSSVIALSFCSAFANHSPSLEVEPGVERHQARIVEDSNIRSIKEFLFNLYRQSKEPLTDSGNGVRMMKHDEPVLVSLTGEVYCVTNVLFARRALLNKPSHHLCESPLGRRGRKSPSALGTSSRQLPHPYYLKAVSDGTIGKWEEGGMYPTDPLYSSMTPTHASDYGSLEHEVFKVVKDERERQMLVFPLLERRMSFGDDEFGGVRMPDIFDNTLICKGSTGVPMATKHCVVVYLKPWDDVRSLFPPAPMGEVEEQLHDGSVQDLPIESTNQVTAPVSPADMRKTLPDSSSPNRSIGRSAPSLPSGNVLNTTPQTVYPVFIVESSPPTSEDSFVIVKHEDAADETFTPQQHRVAYQLTRLFSKEHFSGNIDTERADARSHYIENVLNHIFELKPGSADALRRTYDFPSSPPPKSTLRHDEGQKVVISRAEAENLSVAAQYLTMARRENIIPAARILSESFGLRLANALAIMVNTFESSESDFFFQHVAHEIMCRVKHMETPHAKTTLKLIFLFHLEYEEAQRISGLEASLSTDDIAPSLPLSSMSFARYPGNTALELLQKAGIPIDFSYESEETPEAPPRPGLQPRRLDFGDVEQDKEFVHAGFEYHSFEDGVDGSPQVTALVFHRNQLFRPLSEALMELVDPLGLKHDPSDKSKILPALAEAFGLDNEQTLDALWKERGIRLRATATRPSSEEGDTMVQKRFPGFDPLNPPVHLVATVDEILALPVYGTLQQDRRTYEVPVLELLPVICANVLHEAFSVPWMQALALAYQRMSKGEKNCYEQAVRGMVGMACASESHSPDTKTIIVPYLARMFGIEDVDAGRVFDMYSSGEDTTNKKIDYQTGWEMRPLPKAFYPTLEAFKDFAAQFDGTYSSHHETFTHVTGIKWIQSIMLFRE